MWIEDTGDKNLKLDKRFRKRIISFGPFSIWKSLRVYQYFETDEPILLYRKGVGISEKHMDSKIFILYTKFLIKYFLKNIFTMI